jgi:hypothetical protein
MSANVLVSSSASLAFRSGLGFHRFCDCAANEDILRFGFIWIVLTFQAGGYKRRSLRLSRKRLTSVAMRPSGIQF